MFTGIVKAVGRIESVTRRAGDLELRIACGAFDLSRTQVGDSISVAGVCLTVTRLDGQAFCADVSTETLGKTTLGTLGALAPVNLEPALRAGDALGGHYVTGHVDGVGQVVSVSAQARSANVVIEVPAALARYVAPKGSITVDGVSLTVNEVDGTSFAVNLIPHTREVTTLGALRAGSAVNLEIDVIARYVDRLTHHSS
jgi:riboflavin synthase